MKRLDLGVLLSTTNPDELGVTGLKVLDDAIERLRSCGIVRAIGPVVRGTVTVVVAGRAWAKAPLGVRECWLHALGLYCDTENRWQAGGPLTVSVQDEQGKIVGLRPRNWPPKVLA